MQTSTSANVFGWDEIKFSAILCSLLRIHRLFFSSTLPSVISWPRTLPFFARFTFFITRGRCSLMLCPFPPSRARDRSCFLWHLPHWFTWEVPFACVQQQSKREKSGVKPRSESVFELSNGRKYCLLDQASMMYPIVLCATRCESGELTSSCTHKVEYNLHSPTNALSISSGVLNDRN